MRKLKIFAQHHLRFYLRFSGIFMQILCNTIVLILDNGFGDFFDINALHKMIQMPLSQITSILIIFQNFRYIYIKLTISFSKTCYYNRIENKFQIYADIYVLKILKQKQWFLKKFYLFLMSDFVFVLHEKITILNLHFIICLMRSQLNKFYLK